MPRINGWDFSTKNQTSNVQFLKSSVEMGQVNHVKQPEFDAKLSVRLCKGWLYSALLMNAKGVQRTPRKLYIKTKGGKKTVNTRKLSRKQIDRLHGDIKGHEPSEAVMTKIANWGENFEEVRDDHQILQLLRRPNRWMSGSEFDIARMMFLQATGNYYCQPIFESARFGGESHTRVKELYTLPSQHIKIIPGSPETGELIEGYKFGLSTNNSHFFSHEEVWHEKMFNMADPFYGMGVMEANWPAIKMQLAQKEMDLSRYENMARPDLAVIVKNTSANQDQLDAYQANWTRLFRGTLRTGTPAFITGDVEIVPLEWQPIDQGSREQVLEEIAAGTGVPVSLLLANDPNLASAKVGFAFWSQNTILPLLRLDEEYLNINLLPVYGDEDMILAYDDPTPEDPEQLRADWDSYGGTVLTINDQLERLGMTRSDDPIADMRFSPQKTTLLDQLEQNLNASMEQGVTEQAVTAKPTKEDK